VVDCFLSSALSGSAIHHHTHAIPSSPQCHPYGHPCPRPRSTDLIAGNPHLHYIYPHTLICYQRSSFSISGDISPIIASSESIRPHKPCSSSPLYSGHDSIQPRSTPIHHTARKTQDEQRSPIQRPPFSQETRSIKHRRSNSRKRP
jgi:hypothetical protein